MRFSGSAIAAAALAFDVLFGLAAHAQTTIPSDAEIKAQMLRQKNAASDALGRASGTMPAPGSFKTDVPITAPAAGAKRDDLNDLIGKFQSAQQGKRQVKPGANDLIVFVSFSMPKEVLRELSRQAKEIGAVMAIRGFKDGTLSATKVAAQEVNQAGAEWDIHPDLFKAFKVTSVPTFVVADASAASVLEDGCSPETTFASVSGNISIELALDTIRRRAAPKVSTLAEARLKSIREAGKAGLLR